MNVVIAEEFNKELSTTAKEIFKIIAGHCLYSGQTEIEGKKFHTLLDNKEIDFDRGVIKSIIELKEKGYLEISI
ncbi:MAG: hypothetical protein IKQ46_10495 [Bacteroidales bacterium]|nr:hypothetical protein [Bacteroidales bacterium]